jgi:hypothetical protein
MSWPYIFYPLAIVILTLSPIKAGYFGRECVIKNPLLVARLNPKTPLECAFEELVYPLGFSSFQAR